MKQKKYKYKVCMQNECLKDHVSVSLSDNVNNKWNECKNWLD